MVGVAFGQLPYVKREVRRDRIACRQKGGKGRGYRRDRAREENLYYRHVFLPLHVQIAHTIATYGVRGPTGVGCGPFHPDRTPDGPPRSAW